MWQNKDIILIVQLWTIKSHISYMMMLWRLLCLLRVGVNVFTGVQQKQDPCPKIKHNHSSKSLLSAVLPFAWWRHAGRSATIPSVYCSISTLWSANMSSTKCHYWRNTSQLHFLHFDVIRDNITNMWSPEPERFFGHNNIWKYSFCITPRSPFYENLGWILCKTSISVSKCKVILPRREEACV